MRRRTWWLLLVCALVPMRQELRAQDRATLSADALIEAVLQARETTRTLLLRARISVAASPKDDAPAITQIRIASRRDGTTTRTLMQALWPDRVKGTALYIERTADHNLTGFGFTPPDDVWPLDDAAMDRTLIDSDLRVEDIVEGYWHWPNRRLLGDDRVGDDACSMVELRPDATHDAAGALRACISPRKRLALRVDRLDARGRLMRRVTVTRTHKTGDHWSIVASNITVPGHLRVTTVEFTRAERNADIPTSWFELDTIKRLGRTP